MKEINYEAVYEELWSLVPRAGVKELVDWIRSTDFYEAPCSTEYHLSVKGGLVRHSVNVYHVLKAKIETSYKEIPFDSAIICALGHDLCKADYYIPGTRNVKENGVWRAKPVYKVNDRNPIGHGEKSLSILQDFISLHPFEKLAIRWHMGPFEPGANQGYPTGFAYRDALKVHPLVTLLFTADMEATNIVEAGL